jgi:hypothetical protein
MKKRLVMSLTGVFLLGLFLFLGLFLLELPGRPAGFTKRQSAQIRVGMSEADVIHILGSKAGNYSPEATWTGSGPMIYWKCPKGWNNASTPIHTIKAWIGDEGLVGVKFDETGAVVAKWWEPVLVSGHVSGQDTLTDKVREIISRFVP